MKLNIKFIIEALSNYYSNGNDAEFSKRIGVTPQALSNWKSRNTIDFQRVYTKCLDINPHWLLTGEGDMLKSTTNNTTIDPSAQKEIDQLKKEIGKLKEEIMQLQRKIIQMHESKDQMKSDITPHAFSPSKKLKES